IIEHGNIWDKYFPKTINGIETKRYILNYSWMHPRDIVRLMNTVLKQCSNEVKFTQEMFDRALKDYASASWIELKEGLSLKYSSDELTLIKLILTKLQMPFTFQSISDRIKQLAELDDRFISFSQRNKTRDILNDLFEFGVIGNSGQRMVFKFMEDDDLSLTENMIIHKPLRNFFAVQSWDRSEIDIYKEPVLQS
ncbi:P-loop ATPase, Sll1717 family, partial [Ruminococcus sp.]|uniref:P-loop ATPase, Sll1717 family n=1 Tax=Ruminococcus sp. TaxID=41978 RepID=UPI003F0684A7